MKRDFLKLPMEKLKKYRYPALILLLGLLLLLLPTGKKTISEQPEEPVAASQEDFDLEAFTREAEALLSRMQGAGEVRLLLALETDGQQTYLTDLEESAGETGSQSQRETVLVNRDGNQYPVTVYRRYPEFRGAVVLCTGGDSPSLTLQLKEAVSSLTGLGMDKITVLKSA